ncbi:protein BatD, partial [bacterium]|nr:protein BatD [bacterium]
MRGLLLWSLLMVVLGLPVVAQDAGDDDPVFPPGEDYYVEAVIEGDRRAYLGEQVIYVFRTYVSLLASTRTNIFQDLPDFQGFWQGGVFEPRNPTLTTIHGQQYTVLELIVQLYPARTGSIRIDPARLEIFPGGASQGLFR